MDLYTAIFILTELALLVTISSIFISSGYSKNKKILSFTLCLLIMICAFCEFLSFRLSILGTCKNLHIMLKWLELSIAPIAGILPGFILSKNELKFNKIEIFIILVVVLNCIFEIISSFNGMIFKVDNNSSYCHGKYYFIYVISFVISMIYFIYNCFLIYVRRKLLFMLPLLFLCLLLINSIIIQLLYPNVRIDWLTIAVGVIFIFKFYGDILSNVDSLTNLFNKAYFDNTLRNSTKELTLIFLDVDKFKEINDKYGHIKGDEILVSVAELIKEVYNKAGYVCRYGGDEFAVIIKKKADIESLNKIFTDKVLRKREENDIFPTISLGYAIFDPKKESAIEAIEKADKAMYENKKNRK